MDRLNGKKALVTGGNSGIGQAIALRLAQEGANVLIVGRNENTLQETAAMHNNISWQAADITDSRAVAEVIARAEAHFGGLDVLVNNAGVAPNTPFAELDMTQYDLIFNLNVRALIDITRQALPLLKKSKGTVINISSGAAHNPQPFTAVYCASKAAVSALTKALAKELIADGVRVNAVSAGATDTPLYDKTGLQTAEEKQQFIDFVSRNIPIGRFAQAHEIAGAVAFLASDDAAYALGSDIVIDGGFSA